MSRLLNRTCFILLVLASSLPLAASSQMRMSDAEYCARNFSGAFRPSSDPRLTEIGNRLATNFGLSTRVVFCVGAGNDPFDPPTTRMSGWKDVLYVSLSDEFIRGLSGSLEAVIAHEFAHFVVPDGQMCTGQPKDRYIACESSVDAGAALVVGKSAVLSMLKDLSRYLRYHKNKFEGVEENIRDIERRAEMLRRMDLPN